MDAKGSDWLKSGLCALVIAGACGASPAADVAFPDLSVGRFLAPPSEAKPWTYYFWQNSLTDKETITEEIADIARLGFGGVLLTDSRGYWVDDNHLSVPAASVRWGSDAWLDLVEHVVRECARRGLRFQLNVAASGGHLRGDADAGADNPKHLVYRLYRPDEPFEKPASPTFAEVASYRLAVADDIPFDGLWHSAGDGVFTTAASESKRRVESVVRRRRAEVSETGNVVVRFGHEVIPNAAVDIDVLDAGAVRRHLDRSVGRLVSRVPDLVGKDKTFVGLYNVSWEGLMPTWSVTFAADFRRYAGYDLLPHLPELAGFDLGKRPFAELMADYRRSRGRMMCEHLYGEVKRSAHEHGLLAASESGGPWPRQSETFGEQDQLAFLAANDIPQGEFWPDKSAGDPQAGHACMAGRFLDRGPVSAAHIYGLPIVSAEAFTHMFRHWSADPAYLKPLADIAFANGINRLVWHTYTTSPRKYGVPGCEYFAGTHINRNTTWNRDLPAFVTYLARCQAVLQAGTPVTDIAALVGRKPYVHWGTAKNGYFRTRVSDEIPVELPCGYAFDLVNDEALQRNPALLSGYRAVVDLRDQDSWAFERTALTTRLKGLPPDVETERNWLWCHRRSGETDVYFVAGEGVGEMIFRAAAASVEEWDAVTGGRQTADARSLPDGRTRVRLDLPTGGSRFVVFSPERTVRSAPEREIASVSVNGPWDVSFASKAERAVPAPLRLGRLVDFTTVDGLRYFAGTATYRTSFELTDASVARLSIGALPSGLARVSVNGLDCGVVWCAPWTCDVSRAVRRGRNELVIEYTNNWHNRFIGDCRLPEGARVLKSNVRSWTTDRKGNPANIWKLRPTYFSGYCPNDPLQPSGLLGPVRLELAEWSR